MKRLLYIHNATFLFIPAVFLIAILLRRSRDNLILQFAAQIAEIVAVARNPHNQIAVLLRVRLCLPQRILINNVELHMMSIHPEV